MTDRPAADPRNRAMVASLLVSFLMLGGKLAAYFLTGSTAIYSDAAESVIHLLATGFAGFSLWYAVRPADASHPYGHGKIAYFSAGFEGLLILLAALSILYTAVKALVLGTALQQLDLGLGITVALALVNLLLGLYLIRTGKRHNSLVLISNGQHVLTDMWTSLGVVGGIALVWLTGLDWLDPLVAIVLALNILWTATHLLRQSIEGLMEHADAEDTTRIVATLAAAKEAGHIDGYHQVRHRRVNDQVWIEYHLLLPGHLSLTEAHSRSHRVEAAVTALFPNDQVHITAHLEPDSHTHPKGFAEPDDPLPHEG